MRVKHPYALDDDAPSPDGRVHWGGRREISDVDADGTFYVPDDVVDAFIERWPEANGYDVSDLLVENGVSGDPGEGNDDVTQTPENDAVGEDAVCTATVQSTGEECGRETPCPYHSGDG